MSFDPWGARRNGENWSALTDAQRIDALKINTATVFSQPITQRGFTGHEMVDDMGIIHMNGRIYDPRLGRFLQADPFVDGVQNTQGYNRYSYLGNNPLNATDPTGFFSFKKFLTIVAIVVLSVVTYGAASAWAISAYGASCAVVCSLTTAAVLGGIAGGAAAGFVAGVAAAAFSGANAKDSLRAGFKGALVGAVSGGFGGYAGTLGAWGNIGVSALGGCLAGAASGGSCNKGAELAAMAAVLKVGMDSLAQNKSSLQTSDGEAVVKPGGQLKADMLKTSNKNLDVLDKNIDNTGMGVTVDSEQYKDLVGMRVSDAKRLLAASGKSPAEISNILHNTGPITGLMSESSPLMSTLSRNVGGVLSASVTHDRLVGVIERALHMEGTLIDTAFTVGSIPYAFAAQYAAFGAFSYDYYYQNLNEDSHAK
jgi:RHS repeat-associated protein